MKYIATSQSQVGQFKIDHRIVECQFYRISSDNGRWIILKLVKDAGANLEPYNVMVGNGIRQQFNRRGWAYVISEVFATLS